MDECRARKDLYEPKNTTVFDVYNDLVGTVAFLGSLNASLPAQQDLFVSLNSTVLPTIRGMLVSVTCIDTLADPDKEKIQCKFLL